VSTAHAEAGDDVAVLASQVDQQAKQIAELRAELLRQDEQISCVYDGIRSAAHYAGVDLLPARRGLRLVASNGELVGGSNEPG
jgi:hypothetical protein